MYHSPFQVYDSVAVPKLLTIIETWRKAMKMRLAAAAFAAASCFALTAVPASANTAEPVAKGVSVSTQGSGQAHAEGFIGCLFRNYLGWRSACRG